ARPATARVRSSAALYMIFENERLLPFRLAGRRKSLIIKINDPLVLIGIGRRIPCQGQPHEAKGPLRANALAAKEKQLTEQRLSLDIILPRGVRKPLQGFEFVLISASAIEKHPPQKVLRFCIAETRRGKLKQPERKLGIGSNCTVFNSVQSVSAQSDHSLRNDRSVAPIWVVFIVTFGNLSEIFVGLEVVAW